MSDHETGSPYVIFLLVFFFFITGLSGFMICHMLKERGYRCRTTELDDDDQHKNTPGPSDMDESEDDQDTVEQILRCIIQNEANMDAFNEMLGNQSPRDVRNQDLRIPHKQSLRAVPSHLHTVHLGSDYSTCHHCSHTHSKKQRRNHMIRSKGRAVEQTVLSVGRFRVIHTEKKNSLQDSTNLSMLESGDQPGTLQNLPQNPERTQESYNIRNMFKGSEAANGIKLNTSKRKKSISLLGFRTVTAVTDRMDIDITSNDRAGIEITGTDRVGTERTGIDVMGTDRVDTDRAGIDITSADRVGIDITSADRVGTNRVDIDTASTDRLGSDRDGRNKDGTAIMDTNTVDNDIADTDRAGTNRDGPTRVGNNRAGANSTGTGIASTDRDGTAGSRTDIANADRLVTDAVASDEVGAARVAIKRAGTDIANTIRDDTAHVGTDISSTDEVDTDREDIQDLKMERVEKIEMVPESSSDRVRIVKAGPDSRREFCVIRMEEN